LRDKEAAVDVAVEADVEVEEVAEVVVVVAHRTRLDRRVEQDLQVVRWVVLLERKIWSGRRKSYEYALGWLNYGWHLLPGVCVRASSYTSYGKKAI